MTTLLLSYLLDQITAARRRGENARDAGYTTEAIVVIALLVVLALGVLGVIATKVMAKANSINLNATP